MSVLGNIGKSIAGFAPTLAAMLGGPLAGAAVTALEGALGLNKGAGPDAISGVLSSGALTPEQVAGVRKADQEHAEKMKALDVDLVKINAAHAEAFAKIGTDDREGARKREESVRDRTPSLLAFGIIGSNLVLIGCISAGFVKSTDSAVFGLVGTALGYLVSESKAILAYYFGSSAGSAKKDDTIQAQAVAAQ